MQYIADLPREMIHPSRPAGLINDRLTDSWRGAAPVATETDSSTPPRIDAEGIRGTLENVEETFRSGAHSTWKKLIRSLVERMTMAPESLEIEIVLKAPEPLVHSVLAGVLYGAMQPMIEDELRHRIMLPRLGRHGLPLELDHHDR